MAAISIKIGLHINNRTHFFLMTWRPPLPKRWSLVRHITVFWAQKKSACVVPAHDRLTKYCRCWKFRIIADIFQWWGWGIWALILYLVGFIVVIVAYCVSANFPSSAVRLSRCLPRKPPTLDFSHPEPCRSFTGWVCLTRVNLVSTQLMWCQKKAFIGFWTAKVIMQSRGVMKFRSHVLHFEMFKQRCLVPFMKYRKQMVYGMLMSWP